MTIELIHDFLYISRVKVWLPLLALLGAACSSGGIWRRVETPHFVLVTDLSSSGAKEAAVALEDTRAALVSAAWPNAKFSTGPTNVYVFANGVDFERYFGPRLAGVFLHTSPPMFFLYGSASRWELRRSAHVPTDSVLRHELAHQLSADVWPNQPRWFSEGLANFLEPVYYSDDGTNVIIGGVNIEALKQYKGIRTIKVEDAMKWTAGSGTLPQREAWGLYGISWLLVHWMFNTQPEALGKYLSALQAGTPPEEAFHQALPDLDYATIDKQLFEYQRFGKFDEIPRPLVESHVTEASLSDRVLLSGELQEVRELATRIGKRQTGTSHGGEGETSGPTQEAKTSTGPTQSAKTSPKRPTIDYASLPVLPGYACGPDNPDKGTNGAKPAAATGGNARKPGVRAGARSNKGPTEEPKTPTARIGTLPAEEIQRIVRRSYARFRVCYEEGLRRNPDLGGRISVNFIIDTDGSVRDAKAECPTLPDPATIDCVVQNFGTLKFPKPAGDGVVTVVYPIAYSPGD